jgi:hypothetical protein
MRSRVWLLLLLLAAPVLAQDASEVTGRWSGQGVYLELAAGPPWKGGAQTVRGTCAVQRSAGPLACELERGPQGGWIGGSEVDGDFIQMWLRREGETLVMSMDIVLERHVGPTPAWAVLPEARAPSAAPAPARGGVPWRALAFVLACAVSGGAAWYCRRAAS